MADDEVQKLRERHHDLSGVVQQHTVDLALRGQEIKTMQAEIAHLADTRVSHEELTGALGPIRGDVALNITLQSYAGTLDFGFIGCRDTVPHLQRLAVQTGDALDALEAAVLG